MNQLFRYIRKLAAVGVFAPACGCGQDLPSPVRTKPGESTVPVVRAESPTPAQYFREHQVTTETPNGKIMIDTVDDVNGKIQYKTDDGKKWSVGYTKRTDNTYQYAIPDEVK